MMSAPQDSPIRVLVADDDQLVRAGIAGILHTAGDIEVVAQASDGQEATELASSYRLDIALLDIQMPRLDGISALRNIRRQLPDFPVAMLTTFSDDHLIADAIGAGALGFLLKSDDPQHLINSVRAVAHGGGAFSPRVARWLAGRELTVQSQQREHQRLRTLLSERQFELLMHVGRGHSNAQIAGLMHLSEGTVKQYLSHLFSTLGVENRVHAAIAAYKAGLLP